MATTRDIINISLPAEMAKEVRKTAKKEGYATVSEYFRALIRERRLAKELDLEVKMGGWKKLRSVNDLD